MSSRQSDTSRSNAFQESKQYTGIQLPPITSLAPTSFPSPAQYGMSMPSRPHYSNPLDIPRHIPEPSGYQTQRTYSSTSFRSGGVAPLSAILHHDESYAPARSPGRSNSSASNSAMTSPAQEHGSLYPGTPRDEIASPPKPRSSYFDPTKAAMSEQSRYTSSPRTISSNQTYGSSGFQSLGQGSSLLSSRDRARMKLRIAQQPRAARACGLGERDRRVIDPPPILQLYLEEYNPHSAADRSLLKSPFNMVSCHLISAPDNNLERRGQDVSRVSDPNDPTKELRRLMGQLTISPFITDDLSASRELPEEARIGSYYIFSDLSCRQNGRYKLRFTLLPIDTAALPVGGIVPTAAMVESEEFTVYSAKDFPGMQPSSDLTKRLKSLGASVPIKKGNEGRTKKGGLKKRASGSDDSGNES